ncbi:MAG TPA: hypothetical protein DCY13_02945 [Verrucomicrobiales bacterium]|nr:hypothetical protein [Verrucomicrobiales bacterium]
MSSPANPVNGTPLDLRRWRSLPTLALVVGGLFTLIGYLVGGDKAHEITAHRQFAFSLLTVFAFYTSLVVGSLFLVIAHHLFDAAWSVPTRRICESMAVQSRWLVPIWVVIWLYSGNIYKWMELDPHADALLHAKSWLFSGFMWPVASLIVLGIWIYFSHRLRFWSLRQDETGAAECTYRMRMLSYLGVVFAIAIGTTFGAILWYKGIFHQWFSTMYGVWYFAGSVWLTLATVYTVTAALKATGSPLKEVATEKTFYFLGSLLFAFTVFYAYVTFSQYFIIWNANVPEETFWYILREQGSWFQLSLVIIFGHFFLPFLALLRIDVKLKPAFIIPLAAWAWLMHYLDMHFNIMPGLHESGFRLAFVDIGLFLLVGGWLTKQFLATLHSAPLYPQRDPRIAEAMDAYVEPAATAAPGGAK